MIVASFGNQCRKFLLLFPRSLVLGLVPYGFEQIRHRFLAAWPSDLQA